MTRLLTMLLLVVGTTVAAAQNRDLAALENRGFEHYERGEYAAAIEVFEEAFRISDEPGFLFNIAQAHRMDENCREAARYYKRYLRRMPDAPNASKVGALITEMKTCAEREGAAEPTPTGSQVAPPERARVDTGAGDRQWLTWTGVAALGVGAVGVGLTVKFGLDGRAANDELARRCATACTSAEARAIEQDGKAANRRAMVAGIAGGAAIAAGAVLLVIARGGPSSARDDSASVVLTRGGAVASLRWTF